MKHLLICQLTLLPFLLPQFSFPQVFSSSPVYLWKYALPCHVFRWLHLPFFGIASQNEWGTELIHLYFSCNPLSFFNLELERNAIGRNKAIHLCWTISFKYDWKCECKRWTELAEELFKMQLQMAGYIAVQEYTLFLMDFLKLKAWCWGHIFKLGKSSQHSWSQRNREPAKSEHLAN